MTTDCTINCLESSFTTCLELDHYYQQLLRNQCISMAKHISSTAFYIVTLTIWGGVATPPLDPPLTITLHACFWHQQIGNSLEIMNMQVRIFIRLLAMKYLGFCNVLHMCSIRIIPTFRVYRLYDKVVYSFNTLE